VERPTLGDLVKLGRSRGLTVIEDLGGGALAALPGLSGDPLVADSVAAGPDLVAFSTDKILGGPQGGALVGTKSAVAKVRKDPLARALRLGRLPLVALEATLDAYLSGKLDTIPAVAMARVPLGALRSRAEAWASSLQASGVRARVVDLTSVTGGGTYAGEELPSAGVALEWQSAEALLAALREGDPPVLARIESDVVVCDARTVLAGEDEPLLAAILGALNQAPFSS
jgi:L-seryl-tRNA(Ser) seleniumtransferase